jgi:hypothetical protein
MTEIKIRQTIPDGWGQHACCPLCSFAGMRVIHPARRADQMLCTVCGLSFELEMEGARLHVCHWPDAFPLLNTLISDAWRTPADLRTVVGKMKSAADESAVSAIQTARAIARDEEDIPDTVAVHAPAPAGQPRPPTPEEIKVLAKIHELRQMGNDLKQIRTTLNQAEQDPEQLKILNRLLSGMQLQEHTRQQKRMRLILATVGSLLVVMLAGGLVLREMDHRQANSPASAGTPAPNMLAKALNLSTPVIKYGGLPDGSSKIPCPRTPDQAAERFGGTSSNWFSLPNTYGWIMLRTGQPVELTIPAGMKSAYIDLGGSSILVEIQGPATIKGANSLTISCQ